MKWKGPSVEILLYGAHILSWKSGIKSNAEQTERIFLSSKAPLDGSGPVRGGIPLVFPAFGAPPHAHPEHVKLGQHGFARSEIWTFDSIVLDSESGVSVRLTLAPTPRIQEVYSRPFQLAFVVTLGEYQLSTDLHVYNPTSEPLEFQALLHNYIRCPSDAATIAPLRGKRYFDKTDREHQGLKTEMRTAVDVRKWTDNVYEDTSGSYEVTWPGGNVSIKTVNLKDLVVWNPQSEAGSKIVDMEDGGWEKYVCVEPGCVRGYVKLDGRRSWVGQQVLSLH
uniref:Glucose-6-phosphate 1-epimerase n=1 Tax=Moniliophthora roreri TaxID=221103 RepID=A0A0W0FRW4_MONRR